MSYSTFCVKKFRVDFRKFRLKKYFPNPKGFPHGRNLTNRCLSFGAIFVIDFFRQLRILCRFCVTMFKQLSLGCWYEQILHLQHV